jgi:subtilisin family serine protease
MAARRLIAVLTASAAVGCATAPAAHAASRGGTGVPVPMPYVVALNADEASAPAVTRRLETELRISATGRFRASFRGFAATLSTTQVDRLRSDPSVSWVVSDATVKTTVQKGAVAPERMPVGVARTGGIASASQTSADAAVAVLDTGIDLANTDLDVRPGVNCVRSGRTPQDDNGHGTHVAGTIGARAGNGASIGVAPGTPVYAVKVLDNNAEGRLSTLLCGIEWVKLNAARLNIRVANVSLTAAGSDDGRCGAVSQSPVHAAICSSVAAGILYVAAAGNSGVDFSGTVPAAYREVLAVSAVTDTDGTAGGSGPSACASGERDDTPATYSNFGRTLEAAAHLLAGPGTCVASSAVGGGVVNMTGTSMAAPHVTGAAVRCRSTAGRAGPCAGMTPAQIIARLKYDAAVAASEGLGFAGDPLSGLAGIHRGHLVSTRRL